MKTTKIGPGTKFSSSYADSCPTWEIIRSRGRGVWEAKVVDSPDWNGVVKVFTDAEVKYSVGMGQTFKKIMSDHDKFYSGLTLGSIVHYNNGFEQYVRCEVVMGNTRHDDTKSPHKVLKPIALVGDWTHDLPKRHVDGVVYYGHHVNQIRTGECMTPNFTNIYEAKPVGQRGKDPRNMPAIDLSVPEMTTEEAATAKLWQAVKAAKDALEAQESEFKQDAKARLTEALEIIKAALA
jgi:hypothetical protein